MERALEQPHFFEQSQQFLTDTADKIRGGARLIESSIGRIVLAAGIIVGTALLPGVVEAQNNPDVLRYDGFILHVNHPCTPKVEDINFDDGRVTSVYRNQPLVDHLTFTAKGTDTLTGDQYILVEIFNGSRRRPDGNTEVNFIQNLTGKGPNALFKGYNLYKPNGDYIESVYTLRCSGN